jgi:murein tripeptide amidase MpaA
MPQVEFDRYYRYDELVKILEGYAQENPGFCRLSSLGQSYEGREIPVVVVTDFSTGEDAHKPAMWCDGNIHATEVSASTAVLKILDGLMRDKPEVLKTHAFYLVPRLNPDGAEWALADTPRHIRSSTRPYPFDEEDPYGLERVDMDGDGRILTMRIEDKNGRWAVCEEEPRLLRKRKPGETGGPFYRLLPEGTFHNWDGLTMRPQKIKEGLDMNRNFPAGWRGDAEQHGAGPFPTSEPEIRAAVKFITDHPNVCGGITYHTFSGVILRVPGRYAEDDMPPEDVWAVKELGAKGTEMSGYPCISVYHDFRYHPKEVITGVFDDWLYDHLGVYGWTVEIWSPQAQAGIKDYKPIDWFRDHPVSDDIALLKWSDEKLGGKGYEDWRAFEHPQLGSVEIGGWDGVYAFRNPPPDYLEAEVEPLAEWAVWMAGTLPCLALKSVEVVPMGEVFKIRFAVQNTGYLPTCVSEHAAKKKLVRGVTGEISCDADGMDWLKGGLVRQELGQLKGYSHVPSMTFGWHSDSTDDLAVFEWVVGPGRYELLAWHPRAGRVVSEVVV